MDDDRSVASVRNDVPQSPRAHTRSEPVNRNNGNSLTRRRVSDDVADGDLDRDTGCDAHAKNSAGPLRHPTGPVPKVVKGDGTVS